MPFTLAHAAAAYPLRRTRLVLTALIFGTFAPDLEFFIRFEPAGHFGHSARGFFLFSLPVAFIAFWLFHDVLKEPLAALMPHAVRERIVPGTYPLSLRQPRRLLLVLGSLLVGAATHILWDAFTHNGYWPARHLPWFWQSVTFPMIGELHNYKILQYASSVFGLIVLVLWFRHWIRTAPVHRHPAGGSVPASHAKIARILIPATAMLGGLMRAVTDVGEPATPRDVQHWIVDVIVASISLAWLELMFWGFTLPARRSPDSPRVPQEDHANLA